MAETLPGFFPQTTVDGINAPLTMETPMSLLGVVCDHMQ